MPFLTKMSSEIDGVNQLSKRLAPEDAAMRSRHSSRINSTASSDSNNSETEEGTVTVSAPSEDTETYAMASSESCTIS